jgi:hypothetical protein
MGICVIISTLILKQCYQLTLLVHVMVGTGLPDARHSKVTADPFFTSIAPFRVPSDDTKSIRGGTATRKAMLTYRMIFESVSVNDNDTR